MQRDRQEVCSQTDYILGTYCRMFQDVAARDMQHHSDNYMVLGCMKGEPKKEFTIYLCKVRRSPLRTFRRGLTSDTDKLFSDINTHIPKPPLCERVRRS